MYTIYNSLDTKRYRITTRHTNGNIVPLDLGPLPFAAQSLFVTTDGSIYASSKTTGKILQWNQNAIENTLVMTLSNPCYVIFIDLNNYLYCSMKDTHKVAKKSLDDTTNTSFLIVRGNGIAGSGLPNLNLENQEFIGEKPGIHQEMFV